MISRVAIGSAEIPESAPDEPVVVVVPVVPSMLTDTYAVDWLLPAELPPEDVEITAQDSDTVTLTVTRPDGFAGTPGLVIHLICTLDVDLDTGWVDAVAEGFLSPNWTGTARLRKDGSIVYFQFELYATAVIDGTPKFASVEVLTGLTGTDWDPVTMAGANIGTCLDETLLQLFVMNLTGNTVVVEPLTGVTGDWEDGVTYIHGQVSWVAGS